MLKVHSPDHYPTGSSKEAYEGDSVTLNCFDDSLISRFVRVNLNFSIKISYFIPLFNMKICTFFYNFLV